VALQLALRGGPRVRALILESAITHRFVAADPTEDMLIASGWIPHLLQRVMFWIAHRVVNRLPRVVLPFALGAVMNAPASAVQSCAEQIGQDPTQLGKFKVLFDNSVPLNLRQKGYDNDLWQFAHMPEYLLGEVRVPTLIVHSTRDASVPFEHAQYAASRIPGAELYDVEGCGHLVQFGTSGAAVQARMGEFLRTHLRPV
jgi:pimeloyl-ACP methyl ester carboxylesterase